MDQQSGKFWLVKAFGVFLFGLVFWFVLAVWAGTSYAIDLSLAQDLRSNLRANYADGLFNRGVKYLSLTILGDVVANQGRSSNSIGLLEKLLIDSLPIAHIPNEPSGSDKTPPCEPPIRPDSTSIAIATGRESVTQAPTIIKTATPSPTDMAFITLKSLPLNTSRGTDSSRRTPRQREDRSDTSSHDVIYPILDSVENWGGDRWKAYFIYLNHHSDTEYISIGDHIRFTPKSKDLGQPTAFHSDRSKWFSGEVLNMEFDGNAVLTWQLGDRFMQASRYSKLCNVNNMPLPTPFEPILSQDVGTPIQSGEDMYPESGFIFDHPLDVNVEYWYGEDPASSHEIKKMNPKNDMHNRTSMQHSEPLSQEEGVDRNGHRWTQGGDFSVAVNVASEQRVVASDVPVAYERWGRFRDVGSHEGLPWHGSSSP